MVRTAILVLAALGITSEVYAQPVTSSGYAMKRAGAGTVTVNIGTAVSSSYTFMLPNTAGASGQPLLSAGGSAPMTWGALSGNTSTFATTSGTFTTSDCLKADASGNIVDAGFACNNQWQAGTVSALSTGVTINSGTLTVQWQAGTVTALSGATISGGTLTVTPASISAPGTASLGGIFSSTAPSHQWASGVDTSGNVVYTQPGSSDISGLGSLAALAIPSSGIVYSTGSALGNVTVSAPLGFSGGTLSADTTALATRSWVIAQGYGSGTGSVASVVCGSGLNGGTITSTGTCSLANPGTSTLGGILSSTHGSHQFATGVDTSGNVTYAQPDVSDLSGNITRLFTIPADSTDNTGAKTLTYPYLFPGTGTLSSIYTKVMSSGTATLTTTINGGAVTGCGTISMTTTGTTTNCTAANTATSGNDVAAAISSSTIVGGVEITFIWSVPPG